MPPVKEPTNPLKPRVEELEKKTIDIEKDLEECRDLKGDIKVLNERTETLVAQSKKNGDAIFGSPGINTRLEGLEIKMEEVKVFMGETKKLGYGVLIAVVGIFLEILIQLILSHGSILAK